MLHRLLVPLDGTPFAAGALPYAEVLARRSGATLHLVRASLVRHAPRGDTHEAQIVADERADLAGVARHIGGAVSVTLQHDDPAEAIIGQARQWGADLIIMATHERGPFGHAVFGSVAKEVLASVAVPVLLVNPDEAPPFAAPHRLLVPLDGSPLAAAALPVARLIAVALEAPITLLAALQPEDETTREEAASQLDNAAQQLANGGVAVATLIRDGHAPEVIRAVGEEIGATMIVMGTRGHSGMRQILLGSTADAVLRASDRPLVLVRAGDGETGTAP